MRRNSILAYRGDSVANGGVTANAAVEILAAGRVAADFAHEIDACDRSIARAFGGVDLAAGDFGNHADKATIAGVDRKKLADGGAKLAASKRDWEARREPPIP